jgi:hypothetical protein
VLHRTPRVVEESQLWDNVGGELHHAALCQKERLLDFF